MCVHTRTQLSFLKLSILGLYQVLKNIHVFTLALSTNLFCKQLLVLDIFRCLNPSPPVLGGALVFQFHLLCKITVFAFDVTLSSLLAATPTKSDFELS